MRIMKSLLLVLIVTGNASLAAEDGFFESAGARLHYVHEGAGETVILLHGFSGSAQGLYIKPGTFAALVDAGYHVVALDQIGHGQSDKPTTPERYGLEMVEDVERLIEHLGVEKVHLAGYSMGAKVANTFRGKYGHRLHSIILGGYGWPWVTEKISYAQSLEGLNNRMVLPGNDLKALAAVRMTMYALTPAERELRDNRIPALAIIGDKDEVVSADDFQTLGETMGRIRSVVIPGTHAGPDGAPYKPRYAMELVEFLAHVGAMP